MGQLGTHTVAPGATTRAIGAGLFYAGCVFALAFFTGVLRTMLVTHAKGLTPAAAVLIELPIILFAAWMICGYVLRRISVLPDLTARAVMAVTALAAIITAEGALSAAITGGGIASVIAGYTRLEALLGLGGQIVFAAFPLLRR